MISNRKPAPTSRGGLKTGTYLFVRYRPGRWEVRCCDATANMYLVLAAFLASGIQGAKSRAKLAWKDCVGCPSSEDEVWRASAGIVKRLPISLSESLQALRDTDWVELGMQNAAITFAKTKEREITTLQKMNEEELRAIMIRNF